MNYHQFKEYLTNHSLDDLFQVISPDQNYVDDWFQITGTDYIVHFYGGGLDWFCVKNGKIILNSKQTFDEIFEDLPTNVQERLIFHFDVFRHF